MFPLRIAALRFAPEGRVVLDELDLVLAGEGISVILGPNGSGKTVLLRLLAGLLPVTWRDHRVGRCGTTGRPAGHGFSAADAAAHVGVRQCRVRLAPAGDDASRTPGADDRGAGTRRPGLSRAGFGPPAFRRRAPAPGAGPRLGDAPAPAAARRTDGQPRPQSATEAVERIIREIRTEGAKVLMTTHNLGQATRLADDIIFLAEGRVQEHEPAQRFFAHPQSPAARAFMQGELPWRIAFDH